MWPTFGAEIPAHTSSSWIRSILFDRRMHRLLLLALVLPLLGVADVGGASNREINYDIVAISFAGGRQTNLTHNPAMDVNPAVARDGRIAFLSNRGGSVDLYVMDSNGRNARRLTNGVVDHSGIALAEDLEWSHASWSPRGDKISFDGKYSANAAQCEQHCTAWDVLVIGADGKGMKQIALDARAPAWSPDARLLAFESDVDSYYAAGSVTISRPGSGSVQVQAINNESSVGPAWSPRANETAFQAAEGARTWIYLVRADGTGKRRLAPGRTPTWSPDGRRLALIDNCKLITIGRNGKGRRLLSRTGESVIGVAWSPKGGTLAYLAGTSPHRCGGGPPNLRLKTVTADGKRVHILARESAASRMFPAIPVWTYDGKRILVVEYY